jgi:hypothetical protein
LEVIQEIEERRKSGKKIQQSKSPTLISTPGKNKANIVKFLSNKPSTGILKILNIDKNINNSINNNKSKNNNTQLKSFKSTEKLNIDNEFKNSENKLNSGLGLGIGIGLGSSILKRINSEKILNTKEINKNKNVNNNNPKKLNEFNINTESSSIKEKEKHLNRIISIINLEESMNLNMNENASNVSN